LNDLTPYTESAIAEYIEVTLVLNPFAQGDRLIVRVAPIGTLADLIAALVPNELDRDHISAFLGGDYIEPELWSKVRPKSGASVYLRVIPQDPVSIISILATAAAPTITTALFPALVAGSFAASVAGAAIAMAVTYAASALFGPRPVQNRSESASYAISAARNGLKPYQTVPVVLGTHRMVPPYGAAPYTEIVGNDQFLRFVLVWGYGPVDVSQIKIGNTPIEDFTDVDVEHDFNGSASTLGLYPGDVSQDDLSIRLTTSFVSRTTALNTTEIGITITFATGLFESNSKGKRVNASARIVGEYRLVGAGSWTAWFDETYSDDTAQVKRVSQRQTALTSGQYEVQIRRFAAEQNLTNEKIYDRADWSDLRSFNTSTQPVLLPGIAKSAFRIKATDQLNGIVDQLNALVSLKIPTWTGSAWTTATTSATSNPAAIFRYVLNGAPNKKPVAAANINDAALGAWFTFCGTNGLAFDQVIDFQLSVRDLLQDVANAGKASPAYVDDKWTVVIEQPRSTVVQHFTPRNTRNFAGRILYNEIPDALRIRFFNKFSDYREDERIIYDDGFNAENATTFQVIDLPGQTDPDNVYKLGRHYIAAARLRPEIFNFEIDVEHIVAMRGDLCRLTHDVPGIGQMSGRVVSRAAATIVLDEPVTREAGKVYTLRTRIPTTGATLVRTVAAVATTVTSNTIIVNNGNQIVAGALYQFGEQNLESLQVLIAGIEYLDDLGAAVTCVPYSPEIYNSAITIPAYTTALSAPVSASFIGPPIPTISQVISDELALQVTSSGAVVPSIFLYVQPGKTAKTSDGTVTRTSFFQARFRRSGSSDPFTYMPYSAVDSPYIQIFPVESGINYDIGVRAIGPDEATTSAFAEISNHTVIGATAKPPQVDTFSLNTIGDHTYVEWTYPSIAVDVIGYEIRYSADQNNTSWISMTVLSDALPREARSFTVPSRSGSYAIKALDILGNRSVAATFINASLEDPAAQNVVSTITEEPLWTGTKTDVDRNGSIIQLSSQNYMATWTTLASVPIIGFTAATGYPGVGYYEFGETDLSEVYTSRVIVDAVVSTTGGLSTMAGWLTLAGLADLAGDDTGDEVSVELQVNYSIVDSATPVYQGWRRFVVGDYTARHLKFRAVLTSNYTTISPTISALTAVIDMPDRVDYGNDLISGASTYAVAFSPWFRELRSVTIAAQDMATGDYYTISGKTRTGFDVTFRNSAGTTISRTFDYQAIGFGRERST
jgi:hypothetical protein